VLDSCVSAYITRTLSPSPLHNYLHSHTHTHTQDFYAKLKKAGLQGLRKSTVRSLYWKVYLQLLNPQGMRVCDSVIVCAHVRENVCECNEFHLYCTTLSSVLCIDPARWISDCRARRAEYASLKEQHLTKPDMGGDASINNPLSLHSDSKWQVGPHTHTRVCAVPYVYCTYLKT
jgi:hypothetical protein